MYWYSPHDGNKCKNNEIKTIPFWTRFCARGRYHCCHKAGSTLLYKIFYVEFQSSLLTLETADVLLFITGRCVCILLAI